MTVLTQRAVATDRERTLDMERRRPRGRDTGAAGSSYSGGTYRRGSGLGGGKVGGSTGSGSSSDKGILGNILGQALGGSGTGSGGLGGLGNLGNLGNGLFGSGSTGTGGSGLGGLGSGLGQILNNVGNTINTGTTTTTGGSGFSKKGLLLFLGIAAVGAIILAGSCAGFNMLSQNNQSSVGTLNSFNTSNVSTGTSAGTSTSTATSSDSVLSQLLGSSGFTSTSTGWADGANNVTGLNTSVADGSRAKYTNIIGNGEDKITIMVYLCGSDLESGSAMATKDLQEMAAAKSSDNVELIVFTGGARQWQNNVISNQVNQIYRVKDGGLERLVENAGTGAMNDPNTLASFIQFAAQNFPANRNQLILWDHGGGSISGYAYDEKNAGKGYMTLAEIDKALEAGGVKFDYIGFDACLMGTVENALMLNKHADYLIASEETEPGIGWYYSNFLNLLVTNPSVPTIEIGKQIIDDFTDKCASQTPGQKTTLSIVDLAELSNTVPGKLSEFSKSISNKITNKEYAEVAAARNNTREFATSTAIDQVDLVHLAKNMNTESGVLLGEAIKGAVKYNRTSSNMSNAYGLAVYFPYKRASKVDSAVNTYAAIGMDEDYAKAIQEFASVETSGQISSGGSSSGLGSLFGSLMGDSYYGSSSSGGVSSLLDTLLGGRFSSVEGLDESNTAFMKNGLDSSAAAEYIEANMFDPSELVWQTGENGETFMHLSEKNWELVNKLDMGLFLDDGEGFIDLGLDNQFEFNEEGDLIPSDGLSWVGINGQTVAYYHDDTEDDGTHYTITGHIPALLNDERVNILLVFSDSNPGGYVAGYEKVYEEKDTELLPKVNYEFNDGDKIDFLCDYYTYDEKFQDNYMLGDQLVVDGNLKVTNQDMTGESIRVTYQFRDIYNQEYWTPVVRHEFTPLSTEDVK